MRQAPGLHCSSSCRAPMFVHGGGTHHPLSWLVYHTYIHNLYVLKLSIDAHYGGQDIPPPCRVPAGLVGQGKQLPSSVSLCQPGGAPPGWPRTQSCQLGGTPLSRRVHNFFWSDCDCLCLISAILGRTSLSAVALNLGLIARGVCQEFASY
ncbi:hypothetical protein PSHT_10758 [Puccinia striiformis]|uniref:Uncharacterized protein n=1 Tax=Puccinia striiformis TaxID=27350 RepID=A0A2S4V7J6_9BASI|nr:hypothetical protein PSHT_10758 [Puccinia striiformis]